MTGLRSLRTEEYGVKVGLSYIERTVKIKQTNSNKIHNTDIPIIEITGEKWEKSQSYRG